MLAVKSKSYKGDNLFTLSPGGGGGGGSLELEHLCKIRFAELEWNN